jgi:hypothetical protein
VNGYEGAIGASGSNLDWRATGGVAASTTPSSHLVKAMSLGSDWNPSARSASLSPLGALSGAPKVDVRLPTGYVNQSQYWGQIALFFTCSSAGVTNFYHGPVPLSGPTGSYKTYTFPALEATAEKRGVSIAPSATVGGRKHNGAPPA